MIRKIKVLDGHFYLLRISRILLYRPYFLDGRLDVESALDLAEFPLFELGHSQDVFNVEQEEF